MVSEVRKKSITIIYLDTIFLKPHRPWKAFHKTILLPLLVSLLAHFSPLTANLTL